VVSIPTHPEGQVQPVGFCPGDQLAAVVSIPTHPKGQVQHQAALRTRSLQNVSIPTHPEGQVQQVSPGGLSWHWYAFQSPPTPKGRCNLDASGAENSFVSFNPHPPRRAGATSLYKAYSLWAEVSIPTHPEGQVQPAHGSGGPATAEVSIPTHPEGQVQRVLVEAMRSPPCSFQSPPTPKGRCNQRDRRGNVGTGGFNPHPPRRAGATGALR